MATSLVTNFRRGILNDTAYKLYDKIKHLIKVYILRKSCPKSLIELSSEKIRESFNKKNEKIRVHEFLMKDDFIVPPSKYLDGDFLEILTPFKNEVEVIILDAKNSGFIFSNNHILTSDLRVIYEKDISFQQLPIHSEVLPTDIKKIEGTVAYLSNTKPQNYGHWLIYTLPMLEAYWKIFKREEIDYYYIGGSLAPWRKEALIALGIDASRVLTEPVIPDRAITCGLNRKLQNGGHKYPSIFSFRFIRNLFIPVDKSTSASKGYPKRIYIKRGQVKHREVINDDEVAKFLESIGFESLMMQGRTIREQAEIFSNAEAVISVSGSALSNLLFISDKTTVIELVPYKYLDGFFYALASYAGANYFHMIGEKIEGNRLRPHYSNLLVNIEKLKKICKLAGLI